MRVKHVVIAGVAAAAVGVGASQAVAHHSAAMYDSAKTIDVTGVVKQWKFQNPHALLIITGPHAKGAQTQWEFEGAGASALIRYGVKRNSFAVGDKITVRTHPLRDGRPGGFMMEAVKADGAVVGRIAR